MILEYEVIDLSEIVVERHYCYAQCCNDNAAAFARGVQE